MIVIGPGKYDLLCTMARELARAEAAIVIILNGNRGNGFSCQGTPEVTAALPALLRHTADNIERVHQANMMGPRN